MQKPTREARCPAAGTISQPIALVGAPGTRIVFQVRHTTLQASIHTRQRLLLDTRVTHTIEHIDLHTNASGGTVRIGNGTIVRRKQ